MKIIDTLTMPDYDCMTCYYFSEPIWCDKNKKNQIKVKTTFLIPPTVKAWKRQKFIDGVAVICEDYKINENY